METKETKKFWDSMISSWFDGIQEQTYERCEDSDDKTLKGLCDIADQLADDYDVSLGPIPEKYLNDIKDIVVQTYRPDSDYDEVKELVEEMFLL